MSVQHRYVDGRHDTVNVDLTGIWHDCPKCGGLTCATKVHAPHYVEREGKTVKVDCVGDIVLGDAS